MDVELKYLSAFTAVCEEGGFNKASRKLHLTQPAISYQVKMLEQQLGVQLFERVGRNVVITPEGRELREYCRHFFSEFAHLRTQFKQDSRLAAEPVRIASVSGFGRYILFPLMIQEKYRHLKLDVRFPLEVEVLEMVQRGDADVGFVYEIRISNYLQFEPVYVEELILVTSRNFEQKALDFKQLKTYENLPMITYEEGHFVFGQWFDTNFKRQPLRTVSAHHFEELEEVVWMVHLNRGLSIVPDHVIAGTDGKLRTIRPFVKRKCTNTIFAVTRSAATVRPEVDSILAGLKNMEAHRRPRRLRILKTK